MPRVVSNFRFFANAILNYKNESTEHPNQHILNYTTKVPAGVAVIISPWNLPLYLLSWKIAPCIAAGCTCVCKPSEFTSVTAHLLSNVITKVGLPSGVVNILYGYGHTIGNSLVSHPDVRIISFTGGTVTGQKIRKATGETPTKKMSLELGGKNPGIVFADADIKKLINSIGRSCFQNSGQICLCSSRYFVHVDIVDEFLNELSTYARNLVIGDPLKSDTRMGPVCSREHYNKVKSYIDLAIKNGHQIVCGESVE
jgi:acyl-CoA reductase-like NAD-dependent aldehyde dehydrogenase